MSKSLTNKQYLKKKLYGFKMMEGSNLSQHINMFNQIISDLKRVFENEDKMTKLLNSLAPSAMYKNFVTTLMWEKEILTIVGLRQDNIHVSVPDSLEVTFYHFFTFH